MVRRITTLVLVCTACSRETPKPADTAASTVEVVQQAQPVSAPAAAASKIGRFGVLSPLGAGPRCEVKKYESYSAIQREVIYEGDQPVRTIKVGVGDSTRAFAPINLDIVV